jgi:hypothetical protein
MEAPHEEQENLGQQFNHNNEPLQTTRDNCANNFSTSMQLSNTCRTPECTQWNRTLEYHCDQSNSIVYIKHNQTLQVQTLPSILITATKIGQQKLVKLEEPEQRMKNWLEHCNRVGCLRPERRRREITTKHRERGRHLSKQTRNSTKGASWGLGYRV